MTVAVGYVYKEGIVFCADTKVSTSIKTHESKLAFFISEDGQCAINFAMSSDDSTFPKSAVAACWEVVRKMDFSTVTLRAVHDAAEFALAEFYRDHIYPHPDRTPGAVFLENIGWDLAPG